MKKLMIAAAIVCAAACVQASSVLWSSGSVLQPGSGGKGWGEDVLPADDVNYTMTVLMYTAAGEAMSITDNIAEGTDWLGYLAGTLETEDTIVGGVPVKMQATIVRSTDGATLTSQLLQLTYDGGMSDLDIDFMAQDLNAGGTVVSLDGTFSETTGYWQSAGWQSVPEPTSGLLLLLGVAGLALRRRRA